MKIPTSYQPRNIPTYPPQFSEYSTNRFWYITTILKKYEKVEELARESPIL
jgi:hypothetical protein